MKREEMHLNEKIAFHFPHALNYSEALIAYLGKDAFFNDGTYKRYKEFFIGALTAQALTNEKNSELFVVSPDKDPPDFTILRRFKKKGEPDKTYVDSMDFEIVDYTEHSESIEKVVDDKLAKNYPEDYGIVVFFRHKKDTNLDWFKLREHYKEEKRWIILVGLLQEPSGVPDFDKTRWLVTSFTPPVFQNVITPDKQDKPPIPQMWRLVGLGRDIEEILKPVRLLFPKKKNK